MIRDAMGSDKWNRKSTHQLIELFQANQCLWNLSHDEYKNKLSRKRAIEEIASVLNLSSADIKLKIHRLRTQFSNERNRIIRAKLLDSQDVKRTSKWDYYNDLIFLLFKNESRKVTEIKNDPLETTQLTNIEIYKQDEESHSEHELMEEVLLDNEQQTSTRIEPIQDEDLSTITVLRETSKDTKFINFEVESEQHGPGGDILNDSGDRGVADKQNHDEDEIFGKYIASELRQMRKCPDLRFKLKNGIQRLVWEISSKHSRRSFWLSAPNQQATRSSSNFHEQDRDDVFVIENGED